MSEQVLSPLPPTLHLLEVQQVAHRLNVGAEYVRRLLRGRRLSGVQLGTRWRVDPVDLQAFIDQQRRRAPGEHR